MSKNNLIGADPEVFVGDSKTGKICSAIPLLPGTKSNPEPVPHGAIHHDNVLAELNIDPARSSKKFVQNLLDVMAELQVRLQQHNKGIFFHSVYTMDKSYLDSVEAQQLGCDPDINAWTMVANAPIDAADAGNLRVAGGHVHLSMDEVYPINQLDVVRVCDLLLGVPSVILDPDKERRALYGKAGSFRPKEYGVEYRVLSNFWLVHPELMQWVFNQAQSAVTKTTMWADLIEGTNLSERIQKIINTYDKEDAQDLVNSIGIKMPATRIRRAKSIFNSPWDIDNMEQYLTENSAKTVAFRTRRSAQLLDIDEHQVDVEALEEDLIEEFGGEAW